MYALNTTIYLFFFCFIAVMNADISQKAVGGNVSYTSTLKQRSVSTHLFGDLGGTLKVLVFRKAKLLPC